MRAVRKQRSVEYQNPYFKIFSQEVDFGDFRKRYFYGEYGSKAGILILDGDKVLLVRQYRFLVDRPAWEIPGGKVDRGEDPRISAVRECEEETGIRGLKVKPLVHYLQCLDTVSSDLHLFYTDRFCRIKEFRPDAREVDGIRWEPLKKCLNMIKRGEIKDHFTIIALLYYQVYKK